MNRPLLDLIPLVIAILALLVIVLYNHPTVIGARRLGILAALIVLAISYLLADVVLNQWELEWYVILVIYLVLAVAVPLLTLSVLNPFRSTWIVRRTSPDVILSAFSKAAMGIRTGAEITGNKISLDKPSGTVTIRSFGSRLCSVRFDLDDEHPKSRLLRNVARKFILYPQSE